MQQLWAATLIVSLLGACAKDPPADQDGGARAGRGAQAGAGEPAQAGHAAAAISGDAGLPTLAVPLNPGDPGSTDVSLEVRTDGPLQRISPLIYGTNGAPDIANNHQTVVRSGGNRMTAYNWENNASNAGRDYMFQNDNYLSPSSDPAKPILDGVTEATAHGAAAIVTVPMVDYVSADKNGGGDVRNSGANYLTTRFKQNQPDSPGSIPSSPDVSDAFVYEDAFVSYVKAHAPDGANVLFSLDNEPDLWSSTHAEVHPDPITYAELWDRTQRFSTAIKRVWPKAQVTGPVSYGYNGYVNLQNASDAQGRDFLEWYLDQAKAAEVKQGQRLIDFLDLHWYPEAQGGGTRITENSHTDAVVAAREQAPRSLWDGSYNEKSWIQTSLNGPIDLLHRLRKKITDHYPGTQLGFTEWNYGGGDHISGAIACADVLGIFGREGVGLATYWPLQTDESFAYAALRVYRNYDGKGASFGDVALTSTSSDPENFSVYGSLYADASDSVAIVVISKAAATKLVGLRLAHPSMFASMSVFELSGTSPQIVKQADVASTAANAWRISVPAQSVSVLVPHN